MTHASQEWDFPPTRRWRHYRPRRRKYYDIYQPGSWDPVPNIQPSGWNSPIAKKIIDIYWRTTIAIIKVLLGIALFVMSFCASWLIVTVLTL
jgi:hypothetical protein